MNESEFELLGRIEDSHWWFAGKRMILRAILERTAPPKRLLDLGCGTGGVLRDWARECACYGTDVSEAGLRICARKGMPGLVRSDLRALPFAPSSFDTVLALDVIEHLEDETGFLRAARELCSADGTLIVAVPAFDWLWSAHDETFQHHRRYTARQLEAALRKAGLEPEWTTYAHFFVFPVAAAWRILSYRLGLGRFAPSHDFWPLPGPIQGALKAVYRLEAWLLRRMRLPFGVSVICVARWPAEARPPQRQSAPGAE